MDLHLPLPFGVRTCTGIGDEYRSFAGVVVFVPVLAVPSDIGDDDDDDDDEDDDDDDDDEDEDDDDEGKGSWTSSISSASFSKSASNTLLLSGSFSIESLNVLVVDISNIELSIISLFSLSFSSTGDQSPRVSLLLMMIGVATL